MQFYLKTISFRQKFTYRYYSNVLYDIFKIFLIKCLYTYIDVILLVIVMAGKPKSQNYLPRN